MNLLQNVFKMSVFAEALSNIINNPTRKVAHSLHCPIDVTIKIVLHFSLQPPICWKGNEESNFANKLQDTAPELPGFSSVFRNDVS